jgi:hypothetical protein
MEKYLYKTFGLNNDICVFRLNEDGSRTKFWTQFNGLTINIREIPKDDLTTIDEYLSKGYNYSNKEKINELINYSFTMKLMSKIKKTEDKLINFERMAKLIEKTPYDIEINNNVLKGEGY